MGLNTKSKLLILYGLLLIASYIGVTYINIFGDSKIIIDWLNGFTNMQMILLKH